MSCAIHRQMFVRVITKLKMKDKIFANILAKFLNIHIQQYLFYYEINDNFINMIHDYIVLTIVHKEIND